MRLHAQASVVALVTLSSTLWSRPAAAQAANPPLFSPPTGQNLRDRPDQPADIGFGMLVEGGEGVYYFKGKRVGAEELVPLLSAALTARMAEKVVDFIADASVPYSRILAARDVAAASGACAVALIAQRLPGTRSMLLDDQSPRAGFSRTAIDVQLLDQTVPPPRLNANVNSIVLEVMPGSSYRINTVAVTAANLPTRLRGLYDPRPVKVLL
ncbi:MAG: hypothetical protein ABJE47_14110, partial [bacterium]